MSMEREMLDSISSSAIFSKSISRPVTLKFENVVYTIKLEKEGVFKNSSKHEQEKIILKGVSGIVSPGEMLAILGPSGSGKTTLLTGLGGRLSHGQLSGKVTFNNKPFSNSMRRKVGFVTQDDILYPHLTVTETLVFTALLRLPRTITKAEKIAYAEDVITQLGLTRCKDSIIGNSFLRGVSGGERKRVSIGQEMLINPSLLFLDEPTSGLDSTTALKIVSTLNDLSKGDRTIVMTIHQPSSRLFYMFHKVLLLSDGNPLYIGKGEDAMAYFAGIGFSPLVAMNPSDFMLDLANGIRSDDPRMLDEQGVDPATIKQTLVTAFKTNLAENLKGQLQESDGHAAEKESEKALNQWSNTWWKQCSVLFQRGLKERRHESFSGLRIAQVLIVAFISGLLWWKSTSIQDQVGLLFFMSNFWNFYSLFTSIFTFPPERLMLQKERSSGMYRLSAYFMSRTISDLPLELVLPTVFTIITYFMAGLKLSAAHFFSTLFSLLLNALVSQSIGLAIGAFIMDLKSAAAFASVLMLAFSLVGGYFVQNVPKFISWIKYISVSQYAFKLLLGSQYSPHETYPCAENLTCFIEDFPSVKPVGLGDKGISLAAMAIMLLGYRVLAYVALMSVGRTKK